MSRIPYRRIFVLSLLLALIVVPMAGARTVESPAVSRVHNADWMGATLLWIEGLLGLQRSGHQLGVPNSNELAPPSSGTLVPNGGSCIDPGGNPKPWCGVVW